MQANYFRMFINCIDIIFFSLFAFFIGYDLLFTCASLFKRRKVKPTIEKQQTFAVIFPAYKEDKVIIESIKQFIKQDYPQDKYTVIVVSDHMEEETNQQLGKLPIRLFIADFKVSLKAKAITYALDQLNGYDKVIIMDADNITENNFLTEINKLDSRKIAIQLHRTRKNANTSIAFWDGIAEEMNNTIYRKGHVNIGLSSALIGSGMVFDFEWLKKNMKKCTTFAEDRELEIRLAEENIFVDYDDEIYVYDEKTSKKEVFLKQRARWVHAQFIAFKLLLSKKNINIKYIDKIIQWIPFPKQFRLALLLLISFIFIFLSPNHSIKWWCLLLIQVVVLLLAIPFKMYNRELLNNFAQLPLLIIISVKSYINSFLRIRRKDMSFSSTTHVTTKKE